MSVRGGGGPRDGGYRDLGRDLGPRAPGPRDAGPRDDDRGKPSMPVWRASNGRGAPPRVARYRAAESGGGFHLPGVVRFLLFGGILAALVLLVGLTALRPVVRAGVVSWAWDNPSWITRIGFVGDLVREDLGTAITTPAGTDATEQVFEVQPNDTVMTLATRLQQQGFVANSRAFAYLALENNLQPQLQAGQFVLRKTMTPGQVVTALVNGRIVLQTVSVTFREGIRLEQMTALLETIDSKVDPKAYYDLAKHPTAELLDAFPWLKAAGLPKGASLEGFLYPATYTLVTGTNGGPEQVTDAEALIRMQLQKFYDAMGPQRLNVPSARKMTFFQVVTLASIVQHETAQPDEKALVAGVYQNRLDRLNGFAPLLGSEPTVIYAVDTAALRKMAIDDWKSYFFWDAIKTKIADLKVPKDLQHYQTYQTAGLIPGPISTPTEADVDAALAPDQKAGYLYFLALPNKGTNVFAKTLAEQTANIRKYYPNGFGG